MTRFFIYLLFLFVAVSAVAQVNVSGTVVDKESNETLTGASVIVKGADGKIKKYTTSKGDGGFAISQDSFRRADPDYIFCSADVKETLMTDASYSSLTAVKRQQVIEMEESEITRLGRTAITTASFVAGTVYPELLKTGSESSAEESSGPENSGESSAQEGYKTLQAGDSGDEVKKLQERLDDCAAASSST